MTPPLDGMCDECFKNKLVVMFHACTHSESVYMCEQCLCKALEKLAKFKTKQNNNKVKK